MFRGNWERFFLCLGRIGRVLLCSGGIWVSFGCSGIIGRIFVFRGIGRVFGCSGGNWESLRVFEGGGVGEFQGGRLVYSGVRTENERSSMGAKKQKQKNTQQKQTFLRTFYRLGFIGKQALQSS